MSDKYVRLKDGTNYIYPELYGIDVNNVLANEAKSSYIAIQDCYVFIVIMNRGSNYIYIDDVFVASAGRYEENVYFSAQLKKGQKVSTSSTSTYKVYGLKYHS